VGKKELIWMAKLLNDSVAGQVKSMFDDQLKEPVEVAFFGSKLDCDYCDDTQQLLDEVTAVSAKLSLKIYDLEQDQALARQYRIDKAPGFTVLGRDGDLLVDYGIRFFGITSGHEFSTLIHTLILVSGRDSGLDDGTRQALKELKEPVHLQVFVTPT
jgi:alkyl hydroperoxide reductase subunit AhpF